eukprot:TRINITY_DN4366_c0_g1_i1.p1 TRINITY_DN4366_c0_g1~~TRINITY_DN4366_c0_g1_i1.p1  ORF type:complete len:291 (+),score=76.44 TRINITY_DN4366_c0_g1_i1:49-873(+)
MCIRDRVSTQSTWGIKQRAVLLYSLLKGICTKRRVGCQSMQGQDPHQPKRVVNVPGEKLFLHPFRFMLKLPSPVSSSKMVYYPLEADRHVKHKFQLIEAQRRPTVLTNPTLGIEVDDINMNPMRYQPEDDVPPAKDDVEFLESLFDELDRQDLKKPPKSLETKTAAPQSSAVPGPKGIPANQLATATTSTSQAPGSVGKPVVAPKKPEKAKIPELTALELEDPFIFDKHVEDRVRSTFESAAKIKTGCAHPKKKGVVAQEVFDILPNMFLANTE